MSQSLEPSKKTEARNEIEKLKTEIESLISSNMKTQTDMNVVITNNEITQNSIKNKITVKRATLSPIKTTPPSSTRKIPQNSEINTELTEPKIKVRNYDPKTAREFIKKQKLKRKEKLHEEQLKKKESEELRKQKMQELRAKTLQLVAENVKKSSARNSEKVSGVSNKILNNAKSNPQGLLMKKCRPRSFDRDLNRPRRRRANEETGRKQSFRSRSLSSSNPSPKFQTKQQEENKRSSSHSESIPSLIKDIDVELPTVTIPPKEEVISTVLINPPLSEPSEKGVSIPPKKSPAENEAKLQEDIVREIDNIKQKLENSILNSSSGISKKQEITPSWLQPASTLPYPYNFISAVRKKLEVATKYYNIAQISYPPDEKNADICCQTATATANNHEGNISVSVQCVMSQFNSPQVDEFPAENLDLKQPPEEKLKLKSSHVENHKLKNPQTEDLQIRPGVAKHEEFTLEEEEGLKVKETPPGSELNPKTLEFSKEKLEFENQRLNRSQRKALKSFILHKCRKRLYEVPALKSPTESENFPGEISTALGNSAKVPGRLLENLEGPKVKVKVGRSNFLFLNPFVDDFNSEEGKKKLKIPELRSPAEDFYPAVKSPEEIFPEERPTAKESRKILAGVEPKKKLKNPPGEKVSGNVKKPEMKSRKALNFSDESDSDTTKNIPEISEEEPLPYSYNSPSTHSGSQNVNGTKLPQNTENFNKIVALSPTEIDESKSSQKNYRRFDYEERFKNINFERLKIHTSDKFDCSKNLALDLLKTDIERKFEKISACSENRPDIKSASKSEIASEIFPATETYSKSGKNETDSTKSKRNLCNSAKPNSPDFVLNSGVDSEIKSLICPDLHLSKQSKNMKEKLKYPSDIDSILSHYKKSSKSRTESLNSSYSDDLNSSPTRHLSLANIISSHVSLENRGKSSVGISDEGRKGSKFSSNKSQNVLTSRSTSSDIKTSFSKEDSKNPPLESDSNPVVSSLRSEFSTRLSKPDSNLKSTENNSTSLKSQNRSQQNLNSSEIQVSEFSTRLSKPDSNLKSTENNSTSLKSQNRSQQNLNSSEIQVSEFSTRLSKPDSNIRSAENNSSSLKSQNRSQQNLNSSEIQVSEFSTRLCKPDSNIKSAENNSTSLKSRNRSQQNLNSSEIQVSEFSTRLSKPDSNIKSAENNSTSLKSQNRSQQNLNSIQMDFTDSKFEFRKTLEIIDSDTKSIRKKSTSNKSQNGSHEYLNSSEIKTDFTLNLAQEREVQVKNCNSKSSLNSKSGDKQYSTSFKPQDGSEKTADTNLNPSGINRNFSEEKKSHNFENSTQQMADSKFPVCAGNADSFCRESIVGAPDSSINLKIKKEKFVRETQNNPNQIHLKFQAEVHLLNSFNRSLQQYVAVEKSLYDMPEEKENNMCSSVNLKRGCDVTDNLPSSDILNVTKKQDLVINKLNITRKLEDVFERSLNSEDLNLSEMEKSALSTTVASVFSKPEDCAATTRNPYTTISLGMFDQMIKDEDVRLEHLKEILKLRDKALFDRIKGELAWLEVQKKVLRKDGQLNEVTMIKKKQRGLIIKLEQERHEMQRLKQAHKQAAKERKNALKEQKKLVKLQLASTDEIPTKIRRFSQSERRQSGPLKVYRVESNTEIRSETTTISSRKSSADSVNITTSSVVTQLSDQILHSEAGELRQPRMLHTQTEKVKRALLMKEADLERRRKEAEDLLKWHQRLKEEEAKVIELEKQARSISIDDPDSMKTQTVPKIWKEKEFGDQNKNQMLKKSSKISVSDDKSKLSVENTKDSYSPDFDTSQSSPRINTSQKRRNESNHTTISEELSDKASENSQIISSELEETSKKNTTSIQIDSEPSLDADSVQSVVDKSVKIRSNSGVQELSVASAQETSGENFDIKSNRQEEIFNSSELSNSQKDKITISEIASVESKSRSALDVISEELQELPNLFQAGCLKSASEVISENSGISSKFSEAQKSRSASEIISDKSGILRKFPEAEKSKSTSEIISEKSGISSKFSEAEKSRSASEIISDKSGILSKFSEAEKSKSASEIISEKSGISLQFSEAQKSRSASEIISDNSGILRKISEAEKSKSTSEIISENSEISSKFSEAEKSRIIGENSRISSKFSEAEKPKSASDIISEKFGISSRISEGEELKSTLEVISEKSAISSRLSEAENSKNAHSTSGAVYEKSRLSCKLPGTENSEIDSELISENSKSGKSFSKTGDSRISSKYSEAEKSKSASDIISGKFGISSRISEAEELKSTLEVISEKSAISSRLSEAENSKSAHSSNLKSASEAISEKFKDSSSYSEAEISKIALEKSESAHLASGAVDEKSRLSCNLPGTENSEIDSELISENSKSEKSFSKTGESRISSKYSEAEKSKSACPVSESSKSASEVQSENSAILSNTLVEAENSRISSRISNAEKSQSADLPSEAFREKSRISSEFPPEEEEEESRNTPSASEALSKKSRISSELPPEEEDFRNTPSALEALSKKSRISSEFPPEEEEESRNILSASEALSKKSRISSEFPLEEEEESLNTLSASEALSKKSRISSEFPPEEKDFRNTPSASETLSKKSRISSEFPPEEEEESRNILLVSEALSKKSRISYEFPPEEEEEESLNTLSASEALSKKSRISSEFPPEEEEEFRNTLLVSEALSKKSRISSEFRPEEEEEDSRNTPSASEALNKKSRISSEFPPEEKEEEESRNTPSASEALSKKSRIPSEFPPGEEEESRNALSASEALSKKSRISSELPGAEEKSKTTPSASEALSEKILVSSQLSEAVEKSKTRSLVSEETEKSKGIIEEELKPSGKSQIASKCFERSTSCDDYENQFTPDGESNTSETLIKSRDLKSLSSKDAEEKHEISRIIPENLVKSAEKIFFSTTGDSSNNSEEKSRKTGAYSPRRESENSAISVKKSGQNLSHSKNYNDSSGSTTTLEEFSNIKEELAESARTSEPFSEHSFRSEIVNAEGGVQEDNKDIIFDIKQNDDNIIIEIINKERSGSSSSSSGDRENYKEKSPRRNINKEFSRNKLQRDEDNLAYENTNSSRYSESHLEKSETEEPEKDFDYGSEEKSTKNSSVDLSKSPGNKGKITELDESSEQQTSELGLKLESEKSRGAHKIEELTSKNDSLLEKSSHKTESELENSIDVDEKPEPDSELLKSDSEEASVETRKFCCKVPLKEDGGSEISQISLSELKNKEKKASDKSVSSELSKLNQKEEEEEDSLELRNDDISENETSGSRLTEEEEDVENLEKVKEVRPNSESDVIGVSYVDVRKRVSEILTDATPPRGDKSPRVQDLYVTTYDVMSPSPEDTPETGSPTNETNQLGEVLFDKETSVYTNEAEELLRKQLEIEQEIKQLERQQQNIPYLYVREIPNKPPPPYKPPDFPVTPTNTVIPVQSAEVKTFVRSATDILYEAYKTNTLKHAICTETTDCQRYIFDLCKEIALEVCKPPEHLDGPSWRRQKLSKFSNFVFKRPVSKFGLSNVLNKRVLQLLSFEPVTRNDSLIIRWSRKKRDHVDEILVLESQAEEAEWTNYDEDEQVIKDDFTNDILVELIQETAQVIGDILFKKKKKK